MNSLWRSRLLSSSHLRRHFSVERIRNVWISGLIDPRNTTLAERQLIYNVRVEKEKEFTRRKELRSSLALENTTIQSAITFICETQSSTIIDTSDSFVDFTIDVQAALRAFDGAVLVLSSLHDLQTQSIIIHQQMSKLHLPKLIYIDQDQEGSDPFMLVDQVKSKLHLRCAAVQLPTDTTDSFGGPFDLVLNNKPCPKEVLEKRLELIETVSEVDDELAQDFRSGNYISASDLRDAIRRSTIARKFVPIFMGNAKKSYKCIRELLHGVKCYLPSPMDVSNYAFDHGEKVELSGSIDGPFVALAFTMEHRRLCKLTYLRIYQGVLRKGDFITNVNTGKTIKVSFLVERYSDGIVYGIHKAHAGQIVAVFDVGCSPGDTFTDGSVRLTITPAYSEK